MPSPVDPSPVPGVSGGFSSPPGFSEGFSSPPGDSPGSVVLDDELELDDALELASEEELELGGWGSAVSAA